MSCYRLQNYRLLPTPLQKSAQQADTQRKLSSFFQTLIEAAGFCFNLGQNLA